MIDATAEKDAFRLELQKHFARYSNALLWRLVLQMLPKEERETAVHNLLEGWRSYMMKQIDEGYGDLDENIERVFDLIGLPRMKRPEATAVLDQLIGTIRESLLHAEADE